MKKYLLLLILASGCGEDLDIEYHNMKSIKIKPNYEKIIIEEPLVITGSFDNYEDNDSSNISWMNEAYDMIHPN